ncbi:MAG: DUF2066 domain-containing protein [Halieaceae bacterium]
MRRVSLLLIMLWICLPVQAVVVVELHRAVVEVEDHSRRQLQQATRAGFAQVLVKVSGSREVLDNDEVRAALSQSQRYMQRYQYLRQDDDSLRLQVHFDPQLVNDLLRGAQAPLWTANRPPLLVWLIVDDAQGRHVANRESNPQLIEALSFELERRGVPAVFPLYDLQDTVALNTHDLWTMDPLAIFRASQRYQVANVLIGRMTALGDDRWMGDWLYLYEDADVADSFYGQPIPTFSAVAVDLVADRMASRYAVAAGDSQSAEVLIRVDALADYADYRKVLMYFENIELIDAAWPAYLEGDSVVFRLHAQADAEQLHRIIALNRRLQRQETPLPLRHGPLNTALAYRWSR